jgi:DNA polymerase
MTDLSQDPTRFDLDERQRAMLAEMGVRVWWPASPQTPASTQASPPAPAPAPLPAAPTQPGSPAKAMPSAPVARPVPVQASAPPPPLASLQAPLHEAGVLEAVAQMDWPALEQAVRECRACGLCASRKNTVFGVGDTAAQWMVIGEAPGENEDLQGEPFVGQAGKLLDNMLRAIGLSRQAAGAEDPAQPSGKGAGVYIANTLKCRPPGNRNPEPQELQACAPYLQRQVALLRPRIILAMGRFAVQSLLGTQEPIGKLRSRVHAYQGVPVVVTYHPAYLLRNPADKAKAWADLCLALKTVQDAA